MPKLFTTIVPPSLKPVSEAFQFAPAVRIGDQILSPASPESTPRDGFLRLSQSGGERLYKRSKPFLNEAGATLDDVASLNTYHVGDLAASCAKLMDVKATRIRRHTRSGRVSG